MTEMTQLRADSVCAGGSGRPIVLPVLSASFFFVSAYLYLIVVGRNIPLWVYGFVIGMLAYGAYSTVKKVRREAGAN